jgi:hypothetical protein
MEKVKFTQLKMLRKPLLGKLAYVVRGPARSSQSCTPRRHCDNSSSRLFGVRLGLNEIVVHDISSLEIDVLFYISKISLARGNKTHNSGPPRTWRRFSNKLVILEITGVVQQNISWPSECFLH